MADDIKQQLKERLAREQARHDRQRTSSIDRNAMDVDEMHPTSDNNNRNNSGDITNTHQHQESKDRVQELQNSLRARQQTIDELSKQLHDLQHRFQHERLQYQKEQTELTHLTGGSANTGATIQDVTMSEHLSSQASSGGAGTQTDNQDQSRQIMSDEELAQYLAAQFEREAREEEEEERQLQQQQQQRQRQQQQQQLLGHPNAPTVRTFTYGDPNSGGLLQFSSSSSSSDNHPMGGDPFGPSGMMGFGFDSLFNDSIFGRHQNRDTNDPLSGMRIHPRTLFPGLMFGGALVDDNTDYETLMRMFPPAPRGADHSVIEQLPEDVYKTKPKEKEKSSEKKEEEKKSDDEFHKCCICLESFKEGDAIRRLPCLHIFHRQEIDHWLLRNHLCPICRTPVEHNEPPTH